jgi:hypothetical protein
MLFILFGIDQNLLGTSNFYVLDTENYQWISSYQANAELSSSDGDSSSNSSNGNGSENSPSSAKQSNPSLGSGVIAGIVVGVLAGVSIFYYTTYISYHYAQIIVT